MNQETSPASKAGLIGTRFQVCGMEVGLCGVQGLRETMEDAFIITEMDDVSNHSLLAILDGHAGSGASTLVSRQFKKVLARTKHWQMYVNSLHGSMYRQEVCVTPASSEEGENKRYPTRSRSRSSGSSSSSSSNNSDSDSGTSRNSVRRTRKNSDSRSASFCSEDEDTNGLVGGRKAWADTRLSKVSPASQTSSSTSTLRRGEDTGITIDIAATSTHTQNLNLLRAALVEAYLEMDRALQEADNMDGSGSTAVVAVVTPAHILCANVGDSRCVLASDSRCVALSEDHKPTDETERERIEKAGYFVAAGRVNGELAMSRALGDFQYKHDYRGVAASPPFLPSQVDSRHSQPQAHASASTLSAGEQAVTCVPDVSIWERSAADQVLVLASDGVWDVLGNQDVVKFLSEYLPEQSPKRMAMTEAAVAVVELSLRQGSTDNISAIVARLSSWPSDSDSGAHYSGLQKGAGIARGGRRKGGGGVRTNTGVPTVDDTDGDGDDIGREEEDGDEEGALLSAPPPPPPTPDSCSGSGKGTKRKHR